MLNFGSWTVLPLLFGLLFGCKSAEKTDHFTDITSDLDALQAELKDGIYQIDSVTKSLNRFAAAEGDLRQPLSNVQSAVVELDQTTARIRNLGKDLKAHEAAFQSSWSEEIKAIESSSVRRTAEQGRSQVDSSFRNLEQRSAAIGTKYREWESQVKSIQSSLEADLSPANQKAQAGKIKEVSEAMPRLREEIRALTNELESLAASMKSSVP